MVFIGDEEGKSYNEIAQLISRSKSTIYYFS